MLITFFETAAVVDGRRFTAASQEVEPNKPLVGEDDLVPNDRLEAGFWKFVYDEFENC